MRKHISSLASIVDLGFDFYKKVLLPVDVLGLIYGAAGSSVYAAGMRSKRTTYLEFNEDRLIMIMRGVRGSPSQSHTTGALWHYSTTEYVAPVDSKYTLDASKHHR